MTQLVERESVLHNLRHLLLGASVRGHVVLVCGEAGIGKTSALHALASDHPTVWWGACDALQTPHPLAPLLDIARQREVRFARHLIGARVDLFEAVLSELSSVAAPMLVVIEDVHWADEATLDLIKFLGRRIEATCALLAVSYRDDEVPASHPLRRVIGELPARALTRIELARLSPAGVDTVARRALRSPAGLFVATQGNPFFLAEVLRHPVGSIPRTVQDLVLARFASLDRSAQAVARLVSVVPTRLERWLLNQLLTPPVGSLEACIDCGLLLADADSLSFRHELARGAVESAIPLPVAQSLHAQVLAALLAGSTGTASSRLAHHAALAGDQRAVRRFGPTAAAEARQRGANREAASHLRTVLEQPGGDDTDRKSWLETYALDSANVDWNDEALAARLELDTLYRRSGDTEAEAQNLSRLALLHVYMMRNAQADAASRRAIELLESLPPSPALAMAYGVEASLRMLNRDCEESTVWSRKSMLMATQSGDRQRLCLALSTLGTAQMFSDYDGGCRQLELALEMALAEGFTVAAANAMLNLGSGSGELMQLAPAMRWLRQAMDFSQMRELDLTARYCGAWLALCQLHSGRWSEAADSAGEIIARAGTASITRVVALQTLGRLRLRRGDPGVMQALDEALALAGPSDTLQRIAPVRAARAEAAYQCGNHAAASAEASAALALAVRHRHPWFIGELAYWCWRAGALATIPAGCAEPYALQMHGDWSQAAAAWKLLGCPYEQARALADGDVDAQQEALALFESLGARPAADALRQRLRTSGVRGLARGARQSTRDRRYGLTTRELQVLGMLCEGLRNAEIASRLSRSVRTVDHHLASVFSKLGVESRAAAVRAAQDAGLASQSGQPTGPN